MPAPAVESAFEQGIKYFHWGTFRRRPPIATASFW
jgi:hypothetical protein